MNLKMKSSDAPILTLAFVIIIAFFMPWFQLLSFSVSGYNLGQIGSYGNYVWLIPILAGGTIILSFFQNDIRGIAAATGIIPLLFILYAIIDQSAKDANAASTLISIFGHVVSVGAYITIICSIGIIVAAAGCGMKQFYLGLAAFIVFLFVYPEIFGFRNQDSNASENASSNDRPYTNQAASPNINNTPSSYNNGDVTNNSADKLNELFSAFFRALNNREEYSASACLDSHVDYYQYGYISKSDVLKDINSDWRRYSSASYEISDFSIQSRTACSFSLSYSVIQGQTPKSGVLWISAQVTDELEPKINFIKAKVVRVN